MNKISINRDQTWDCYSKLSAYILDLLCGCLLSGNKIIGKHFQVNFSNNLELILMKLSTFMEFAEIISTCEAYPQRIERLAFQATQKVGQKKVPSCVSNESSSEILVLCHWVEMKTSGKN